MSAELFELRIMVVEDDLVQAMFLKDILTDAGAETVGPFRSTADAMGTLKDDRIDVAIIDFALDSDTSVELQVRLEQLNIPYVVVTGYPRVLIRRGTEQTIIGKPVSPEHLVGVLAAKARQYRPSVT